MGFFHSGEFTIPSHNTFDPQCHLTPSDIAVDKYEDPSYTSVHIKHSKTDPFRRKITLYIGRNKSDICPVDTMLHYLVLRGNYPGPLFHFASGASLTCACLVNHLRQAPYNSWCQRLSILGRQLSDWCSHDSHESWFGRFPD